MHGHDNVKNPDEFLHRRSLEKAMRPSESRSNTRYRPLFHCLAWRAPPGFAVISKDATRPMLTGAANIKRPEEESSDRTRPPFGQGDTKTRIRKCLQELKTKQVFEFRPTRVRNTRARTRGKESPEVLRVMQSGAGRVGPFKALGDLFEGHASVDFLDTPPFSWSAGFR